MAQHMQQRKKRTVAAAVAVVAVLAVVVAGVIAYLQDASEAKTNQFNPNDVSVDLNETTGDDYNIIPGTSEAKDPEVTATTTLPAYVFVRVDDNTNGLVTWAIADGWSPVPGYENVWYLEFTPDTDDDGNYVYTEDSWYVLEGNTVYYDPSITKEQIQEAGEDINLTFQSYIIQQEGDGITNVARAYEFASGASVYGGSVSDADGLSEAISSVEAGQSVSFTVTDDITLTSAIQPASGAKVTLDIADDKTVDATYVAAVSDGSEVTINGGTLNLTNSNLGTCNIEADEGGTVNLNGVTVNSEGSGAIAYNGTLNITDSTIDAKGYYAVSTNASKYRVNHITITDSTLTAVGKNKDNCGVLFNTDGTLDISGSTINADRQAVIVRGGTATITNTTISDTMGWNWSGKKEPDKYINDDWGSGNEVPAFPIVVGDTSSTAYNYDASLTLSGVTFTKTGNYNNREVYIADDGEHSATLIYDSNVQYINKDNRGGHNSNIILSNNG